MKSRFQLSFCGVICLKTVVGSSFNDRSRKEAVGLMIRQCEAILTVENLKKQLYEQKHQDFE